MVIASGGLADDSDRTLRRWFGQNINDTDGGGPGGKQASAAAEYPHGIARNDKMHQPFLARRDSMLSVGASAMALC